MAIDSVAGTRRSCLLTFLAVWSNIFKSFCLRPSLEKRIVIYFCSALLHFLLRSNLYYLKEVRRFILFPNENQRHKWMTGNVHDEIFPTYSIKNWRNYLFTFVLLKRWINHVVPSPKYHVIKHHTAKKKQIRGGTVFCYASFRRHFHYDNKSGHKN